MLLYFITLVKMSRHAPGRYGQFLRPDDGQEPCPEVRGLHLYLGRALTREEFNEHFPKAIASLPIGYTNDVPVGMVCETSGEPVKAAQTDEVEQLKRQHADEVARIQQAVNEFTATHNENLRQAQSRIEELELLLTPKPETLSPVEQVPETAPAPSVGEDAAPVVAPGAVDTQEPASKPPAKKSAKKSAK